MCLARAIVEVIVLVILDELLPTPVTLPSRGSLPFLDPALQRSLGFPPFRLAASLRASLAPTLRCSLEATSDLLPEFPAVFVDDAAAAHIRQGRDFNVSPFRVNAGSPHVKAIGADGRLVAIGEIAMPNVYHPMVVLN